MKIMSYNIQNDCRFFNNNHIKNKAIDICNLIITNDIDIIGFQELSKRQLGLYKRLLKNYNFIGSPRNYGINTNEYCGIFIKKGIKIKRFNTYSISKDISKLGSRLDNHNYPRICTLCHIDDYLIINTHLDNSFINNKKEELSILKKIIKKELNKENIILMGDFNCESKYLESFSKELKLKNVTNHLGSTFRNSEKQIDHIFISNKLNTDYKEKLLVDYSDHYPLVISIEN